MKLECGSLTILLLLILITNAYFEIDTLHLKKNTSDFAFIRISENNLLRFTENKKKHKD